VKKLPLDDFIRELNRLNEQLRHFGPSNRLYLKALDVVLKKPGFVKMDTKRYLDQFKLKGE